MSSYVIAPSVCPESYGLEVNAAVMQKIDDVVRVLKLEGATQPVRRGKDIFAEGARCVSLFILLQGVAIRYRILRDGQRQVLNVILPGDIAGAPSCFFETALYSIKTVTPAVVLPIPMNKIMSSFSSDPAAAAKIFWQVACETAVYAERLITIGRRSAVERVAHFLLELFIRMRQIGLVHQNMFCLPLTQAMLSDAVGLSVPYLNRVLHQLREDGYISMKGQDVGIKDFDELANLADFEAAYLSPTSMAVPPIELSTWKQRIAGNPKNAYVAQNFGVSEGLRPV